MKKIAIISPCYNQLNLDGRFATSLIKTIEILKKEDIHAEHAFIENTTLLNYNLNQAVNVFLEDKDYTDFVFINSNIIFQPQTVLDMVTKHEAQRILGGSCKTTEYGQIPRLEIELDLEKKETMPGDSNLLKVNSLFLGFVKIKREVFEENEKVFEKIYFKNSQKEGDDFEEQKSFYFTSPVLGDEFYFKGTGYKFFNRLKKEAGEDLWCHLDFNVGQTDGNYVHQYPLNEYVKMIEHFKEQQKKQKPEEEKQELN